MQVRDIMTKHIEAVSGQDMRATAAQKMRDYNIGAMPVHAKRGYGALPIGVSMASCRNPRGGV
jgi:CBS-domain-containing membrane protein